MKKLNLKFVNEINQENNLDYIVEITDYLEKFQRLEFVNKSNELIRRNPVIGTPLQIQYYLLGMKKYAQCMIPF